MRMRVTCQYFPKVGAWDSQQCYICGAVCEVERDVMAYTSWAAALGKKRSRVDKFWCRFNDAPWHHRVSALGAECAGTSSSGLLAILFEDIRRALAEAPKDCPVDSHFVIERLDTSARSYFGESRAS